MFSNIAVFGSDQGASDFKDYSSKGTMLQDVVNPPDQLQLDEISSPISSQLFEFCDPELFQADTLTNSEVASCSNCCYEDNSSYTTNLSSIHQDLMYNNSNNDSNNGNTTTTTPTANNNSNLTLLFDSQDEIDNDISASIDFSPSPPFTVPPPAYVNGQQDQFDFSSLQPHQAPLTTDVVTHVNVNGISQYPPDPTAVSLMGIGNPSLRPVFEEDCLSSVPSFLRINNPSSISPCSLVDLSMATYFPGNLTSSAFVSADNSGAFLMGSDQGQPHELEFQGDNGGIYSPDSVQRLLNSGDLQELNTESQQLVNGGGGSSCTQLASDMSSLEETAFKVGKLSVEQRKEKIHRYMKKRNERNFSKKIKYACRKTLADSRPRVRGRFAKNEEFGDNHRPTSSMHEDDDDEDLVTVKEEDDMVDSSDIFAHISGVNSFKCNYSIQSWI